MNLPKARNTNIVVQSLGKEQLIYDLGTNQAYNLNETSTIVFNACDGETSFDDLKRRHKFTADLIYLTLDELQKRNLLASDSNYNSPLTGMSRREAIRHVGLSTMVALPIIAGLVAPHAAHAASTTCNANTQTDINNCGQCGNACNLPNAFPICIAGNCVISQCNQGFADCDNNPLTGCETNIFTDRNNCGACGAACNVAGATCVGGKCVIA